MTYEMATRANMTRHTIDGPEWTVFVYPLRICTDAVRSTPAQVWQNVCDMSSVHILLEHTPEKSVCVLNMNILDELCPQWVRV
jgi:hypothetical protein